MTEFFGKITFETIWPYLKALIILLVGVIILKVLKKVKLAVLKKTSVPQIAYKFIERMVIIVVWVIIALSIAQTLGFETGSILTLFAAGGAAVALAIQDSLSNFFGGCIVMASDILAKGDYISVDGVEGTVDSIDVLHTTLLTPDNKIVTIPNATMNKNKIINCSRSKTRRIDVTIGISYNSDSENARYVLTQMAMQDNRVLEDPQPSCHVTEYADSAVVLCLRAWVRTEDYWDVNFYLKNNIKSALVEAGIEIPFPQIDVHLNKE